jgi:hypothetical protein
MKTFFEIATLKFMLLDRWLSWWGLLGCSSNGERDRDGATGKILFYLLILLEALSPARERGDSPGFVRVDEQAVRGRMNLAELTAKIHPPIW